jgi:hypothetical protein
MTDTLIRDAIRALAGGGAGVPSSVRIDGRRRRPR